jgi:hypothetical protein
MLWYKVRGQAEMIKCSVCSLLAMYLYEDSCVWCLSVKKIKQMQKEWKLHGRKSKKFKHGTENESNDL